MIYEIALFSGIGSVKFGMTVSDVRDMVGEGYKSYNRVAGIEMFEDYLLTDSYNEDGIFFDYDKDGVLEAISFFVPARPMLDGVDVLSLAEEQVISFLKGMDPELIVDSEGCISKRCSLGIRFSPSAHEGENATIYSFLFGRADYYDS